MKNEGKKASFKESSSPRTGMQLAASRVRQRLQAQQNLPGFYRHRRKKKDCQKVNHPKPWDTRATLSHSLDAIKRPHLSNKFHLSTKLCKR